MIYDEIAEGGVIGGGSIRWSQIDSWRQCSACGAFTEEGLGGPRTGGTAVEVWDIVEGGCTALGHAPAHTNDIYDDLAFCFPLDEFGPVFYDRTRWKMRGDIYTSVDSFVGAGCLPAIDMERSFIQSLQTDCLDGEFTATAWVYFDQSLWSMTFLSRGNFQLGVSHAGKLYGCVTDSEGEDYKAWGTTRLQDEKWYHVAATWDRKTLSIYLDGKLEGSVITPDTLAPAVPLCIGAHDGGSYFTGRIQEVRLWGRILTPATLAAERFAFCRPGFTTATRTA